MQKFTEILRAANVDTRSYFDYHQNESTKCRLMSQHEKMIKKEVKRVRKGIEKRPAVNTLFMYRKVQFL
jgi:hypothetical protein